MKNLEKSLELKSLGKTTSGTRCSGILFHRHPGAFNTSYPIIIEETFEKCTL